jgi:hypothetical protein
MEALTIQTQSLQAVQARAADALVARRLDMQERQRRVNNLLNDLWLHKQQLLWQLESEILPT